MISNRKFYLSQSGLGTLEATAAILSQVSGGSEGPLLHHLEELARKDQEVSQLRREKRQLETTMREVQMAALNRQQAQQDKIERLEEEAERYAIFLIKFICAKTLFFSPQNNDIIQQLQKKERKKKICSIG